MDGTAGSSDDDKWLAGPLTGDAASREWACQQIDEKYRRSAIGTLRSKFPGLDSADLVGAWYGALADLSSAAQGSAFNATLPIYPYILRVAFNKATTTWREGRRYDRLLTRLREGLRGRSTGARWRELNASERHELLGVIDAAIKALPPRQREVTEALRWLYVETGHEPSIEEIRQRILSVTGLSRSTKSIEGALSASRRSVSAALVRAGFDHP